jgi:hypothetical protein
MDFYACHRMTNDRHRRIYADGNTDSLPARREAVGPWNEKVPGDYERALREYDEYNAKVKEILHRKGFQ